MTMPSWFFCYRSVLSIYGSEIYGLVLVMLAIICIIVESTNNIYPVLFSEVSDNYQRTGNGTRPTSG